MFQKKDYIFNENIGVCYVADIVKLYVDKNKPVFYYVLRSVKNNEKVSYIPVEHHEVKLRELIEPDMAKQLLEKEDKLTDLDKEEAEFVLNNDINAKMR